MVGTPFTSAMPFRILNKGPDYFRRPVEPGNRKMSAVERLEADKAKYVKSQQVASTRQEPVKPPVIRKPLMSPSMILQCRVNAPPARKALRCPGDRRGAPLNLDILNNLINISDPPPVAPSPASSPLHPLLLRSTLPPASPAFTRLSSASSRGSTRKHPSLHRSKSDLSDRYSRATADLERFFNYCGLDPEEVEGMGVEHFARASSDIVSVSKLRSVSTPSSECAGQSQHSCQGAEEDEEALPSERVPYGISVIERNARVIKWLYGIRQARDTHTISNV
ncbi:protein FAM110B-like [Arapaima gigas]